MIKRILPCLTVPGILYCPEEATPEMITALEAERQRMNDRIQFLTRNRDAITAYIDAVQSTRDHCHCERRQTPGRDSRDGTQPAGRDPAPGR